MTTPSRVTRLDAVLRKSEGHRQHFSAILLILKTDKNPRWILSVHHLDAETADHLTAHLIKGKSSTVLSGNFCLLSPQFEATCAKCGL